MKKAFHLMLALVGVCGIASAANYSWQGKSADWTASGNWYNDSQKKATEWADGQNTFFKSGVSLRTVNVDKNVTPGRMNVQGDYTFIGSGVLTLNEGFYVSSGKTATMESPLAQTSTGRLSKLDEGTLVLKGTNSLYRFAQAAGTTRLDGGTLAITGTGTSGSAGESTVVASFGKGNFVVEGGATFVVKESNSFISNSGAGIYVTNGTFDVTKVGEFLNGFGDNNGTYASDRSFLTVADKGTVLARKIRIAKTTKENRDSCPDYGLISLNRGGTLRVNEFGMDGSRTYYSQVNFNGGVLQLAAIGGGTSTTPFSTQNNTRWSGVTLNVQEGGAHICNYTSSNRELNKAFTGAEEGDGGLHFTGNGGVLYMNAANTVRGGTWLEGNVTYVPKNDQALGVVPDAPTNNIFITSSSPTLHMGGSWDTNPNRNVLVSSGVTFRVGAAAGVVGRICGEIGCDGEDPTDCCLRMVENWNGTVALAPDDDRTNRIGRLNVLGHLRVDSGTTLVTRNTGGQAGENAAIYVKYNSGASSLHDNLGILEVKGGLLKVVPSVYVVTEYGGQIKVSGGTFDASAAGEILNGMSAGGKIEVSGTGTILADAVRISQVTYASCDADGLPLAQVHVATGGVLKLKKFYIDDKHARYGRVDLDGGTLVNRDSRIDFLGTLNDSWNTILVRACAGGAIFDTDGFDVSVRHSIASGAVADGGLTKKGAGTLTLTSANTYNGLTRVDGGTLKFTHQDGFPGGDIVLSAATLKDAPGTAELINAVNLSFKGGSKIRIVDPIDPSTFGKKVVIARTANPIARLPPIVLVDAEGREQSAEG